MPDKNFNGGCQCGAVRYQAKGKPIMPAICHCSMCRRANAAPVVAWAVFEDSQVTFTRSRPRNFASSQEAARGICGTCGTQISLTDDYIPALIHITIANLDQPASTNPELPYWHAKNQA